MKQKHLRLILAWGVYGFTQAREGMRNFLLQTFPLNMYVSTNTFLSPAQTYQTFRNTSERAGGLFGVWYWSLVPDSPQISPRLVLQCTLYLGPSGVGWDSSRAYNLKMDTCCGFQFKIWLLHYTKQESVQCRGKNDI